MRPQRRATTVSRVSAAAFGTVLLVITLAACSHAGPPPSPSAAQRTTTSAPAAPGATTAPPPTFDPQGTASDNLAYFNHVNESTLAAKPKASGGDFVAGLVAAGFSKAAMQVTADATSVGLAADSVQFSVLLNGTCLIGQNGAGSGGYHGEAVAVLATGKCLIGETRPLS